MSFTLYYNPLVQGYTSNSADPFYSNYADVSNPSLTFGLDKKLVFSLALELADTYVFTPADLQTDDGVVLIAKVIGAARVKTTGVDTDQSTAVTGYLPTYGTALLPGYVLLSTLNVTAFEILGQADGTTIELFVGSKEGIVASNIGTVTQANRTYANKLALTTSVTVNVTQTPGVSITLEAGSYEISGGVTYETAGTITAMTFGISTVSATFASGNPYAGPNATSGEITMPNTSGSAIPQLLASYAIPSYTFTTTTSVTLYLVAGCAFSAGATSVNGYIQARKVL